MKKNIMIVSQVLMALCIAFFMSCRDSKSPSSTAPDGLEQGKRISINSEYSFAYAFDKKPAMGMLIVKIQVFDRSGKQAAPFKILGDSGMPSMKGAHDTTGQEFKLNKRGDYLLPVNIVMPGDWEITIKIYSGKEQIYTGAIRFDV